MNKPGLGIKSEVSVGPFGIDKSEFTKGLVITGSWNAYCLAETSDKFVFVK
jgi:hypothetical protein